MRVEVERVERQAAACVRVLALTFAFLAPIKHATTGLAAYLPVCTAAWVRQQPWLHVGRTERMLADYAVLASRIGGEEPLPHTHHFPQAYPQRTLSSLARDWLRAFYADDFRCISALVEAGLLPPDYLLAVTNETASYAYWPSFNRSDDALAAPPGTAPFELV